jgi:hypothetical protein
MYLLFARFMNKLTNLALLVGLTSCTSEGLSSSAKTIPSKPYDPLESLITHLTENLSFEYPSVCLERTNDSLRVGDLHALRSTFSLCDSNYNPLLSLVDISYTDSINQSLGSSIGITLFNSPSDSSILACFNDYGDEINAREMIIRRPLNGAHWSEELMVRDSVFQLVHYPTFLGKDF